MFFTYKLSQIHSLKHVICVTYKKNPKHPRKTLLYTETVWDPKQILCGFNKFQSLHTQRPFTDEHSWVHTSVWTAGCALDLATVSQCVAPHAPIAASLCKHVQLQESLHACSAHVPQVLQHINAKYLTPAKGHNTTHYCLSKATLSSVTWCSITFFPTWGTKLSKRMYV